MNQYDQQQRDLFVSYALEDQAWVEGYLLDALSQTSIRYNLEPTTHADQARRDNATVVRFQAFEQALATHQHVLLVLSSSYRTANLTELATRFLQRYGPDTSTWPVTLLMLQSVELPPRLTMLKCLDATTPNQWPRAIEGLCETLHMPIPGGSPEPPCPYPGLAPFGEIDTHRFFGRDQEVQEILGHMRDYPFLALIGPSGSGKSSLVFAGLLPALRRVNTRLLPSGSGAWLVRTLRPGEAPLAALGAALDGQNPATPARAVTALQARYPGTRRLLLIIDQFEELFTLAPHEAIPFQQTLLHLVEASKQGEMSLHLYVIVVLRADFYPYVMESPLWAEVQGHRLEVMPLSGARLHAALVRPAREVGVFIDPALVQRLSEESASEPSALPLVQETMILLWERLKRRYLPLSAYAEALIERGIKGGAALHQHNGHSQRSVGLRMAMAHHAETVFKALSPAQQTIARHVLLGLVRTGEGHADTCRQQPVVALRLTDDDALLFEQTLRHLTEQRLITLTAEGEQPQAVTADDHEVRMGHERDMRTRNFIESSPHPEGYRTRLVQITHEALLHGWPRLRLWLAEHRAALHTRQRLDEKVEQWVRLGRGPVGLLNAAELVEAEAWLRNPEASAIGSHEALRGLVQASQEAQRTTWHEPPTSQQDPIEAVPAPALLVEPAANEQASTPERHATTQPQARRKRTGHPALVAVVLVLVVLLLIGAGIATGLIPAPVTAWNLPPLGQVRDTQTPQSQASSQMSASDATDTLTTTQHAANTPRLHTVISRQLAAQARDQLATRPDLGLLLSVEANRQLEQREPSERADDPTYLQATAEARSSLLAALQANPTLLKFLRSHHNTVSSVAFSPDGRMLASASCAEHVDSNTSDTDAEEKRSTARMPRASCSQGEIHLWEIAGDEFSHVSSLHGHTDGITSLDFSPDGTLLASSSGDNGIILWDMAQSEQRGLTLQGHTDAVVSLDFSPDGTLLASASWDESIILWDVASGQPLGLPLRGHTNSINTVAFNPDGTRLASGSWDGSIIVWDVAARQPVGEPLLGHAFAVGSVAFSPDGSILVSGGIDAAVMLWNTTTGEGVMISAPINPESPASEKAVGHTTPINSVAFSPDSRLIASASDDGSVLLWRVAGGGNGVAMGASLERAIAIPPLHDYGSAETIVPPMMSIAFSPDSTMIATSSGENAVLLWDVAAHPGARFRPLGIRPGGVPTDETISSSPICIDVSPDGSTIATGNVDSTIALWHTPTTSPVHVTTPTTSTTTITQTNPHLLQGHSDTVTSVSFSPDGSMLASGSLDDTIIIWDMNAVSTITGTEAYSAVFPVGPPLVGHADAVTSVAFSPGGNILASASMDGSVLLWDIETGQPQDPPLQGHAFAVHSLAFSPDGTLLATAGKDTTIILWDVATSQPLDSPLVGHTDEVHALAFSPDSRFFASRSVTDGIIVWDVETRQGTPLYLPEPGAFHQERLGSAGHLPMSLAFSPDSQMLVSGTSDGTLVVWDVATLQLLGTFQHGETPEDALAFLNVAFSPDDPLLASARFIPAQHNAAPLPGGAPTIQGDVMVWDTSVAAWQERACRIAHRNLTREEWERFIGLDQEYRQTCE